ncbi:MAG: circularly permuted type 2 ATP-grasp protein [Dehalococcoidia bacterium]|nr:circularly permuted type 2 ATP-grasp protein [Dehalococcoidia bacterium]MCA9825784.1 circularly permuted type 2 ATP-grasp protein [Dehalococcoidia bacterium]
MERDWIERYGLLPGPDEMVTPEREVRPAYREFLSRLARWGDGEFEARQARADLALLNAGITFTVYSDDQGTERIFPFSLVPRIIGASEWARLEEGLIQRVTALNLFLADVYGEQRCLREGIVPADIVLGSVDYNKQMSGWTPPLGVYAHIVGCDLIRDQDGTWRVLEDNLRSPSGVSYVMENRTVMLRVAPDLFPPGQVHPVNDYGPRLRNMLIDVRPPSIDPNDVNAVVLTPGIFNSAYFEHAFLAQQMGITLCEGQDLVVHDDIVYLRSTTGLERVHVIYRRIDDAFLDPLVFRPDSALGVPGLVNAYREGNVTLVNAIGTGVADDKVVYRFVPDLIRFFLGEEPILPNVETYLASLPEDRAMMKERMAELVFKPANASGGYGLVVGPQASKSELEGLWQQVEEEPRNWLAQPLLEFSSIPTVQDGTLVARRADLRPYVLTGESSWVLPGGLTRVALREGSYVVNSSQGGGSKDTWVLTGDATDA